jgi:hypothetical protein
MSKNVFTISLAKSASIAGRVRHGLWANYVDATLSSLKAATP